MFEALFLVISVGLQTASSVAGSGPGTSTPIGSEDAAQGGQLAETTSEATVAPPAFLAPQEPQWVAEPQIATGKFTTAVEVKPILDVTRGNWISIREYDGQDLVYVTHLWAWRCGLLDLRVGINGHPVESWPMPDCHLDQATPGAILEEDGLPYRSFALGSVASIDVEVTYDDLTTDSAKFNRQGGLVE